MKYLLLITAITSCAYSSEIPNAEGAVKSAIPIRAKGSSISMENVFTFSLPSGFLWEEQHVENLPTGVEFVHWIGTRHMHNEKVDLIVMNINITDIPDSDRIEFASGFLSGVNKTASRLMRDRGYRIYSIKSSLINGESDLKISTDRTFKKADKLMFSYDRAYFTSMLYLVNYYGVSAEEPAWVLKSSDDLFKQLQAK